MPLKLAPLGALPLLLPLLAGAETLLVGSVWPYRVESKGEELEYLYDLTRLKAGALTADLVEEVTADELASFLASLPQEARLSVRLNRTGLSLGAPEEPERAPLSPSFSRVSSAELSQGPVIGRKDQARLLPELHPDWPKLLPSVDLVLWKARQLEHGALAAIELATESGGLGLPMARRELWKRVLERAASRYRAGQGDAKEGAAQLSARVGAALCLDPGKAPPGVKASPELMEWLHKEVELFRPDPSLGPPSPYGWTPELRCIYLRERVLGAPLPNTRAGAAAALTLLAILEEDPKLARAYQALGELRGQLHGAPAEEALLHFRAVAGEGQAQAAVEDLPSFFEKLRVSLGVSELLPQPALFALPSTPLSQFFGQLRSAERVNAMEELALAVQDGRLPISTDPQSPWANYRAAALFSLLRPEEAAPQGSLTVDAPYRARLASAFQALWGAHHEGGERGEFEEASPPETGRVELKVRLLVPPHLLLEPLPEAYGRAAASLGRLSALLSARRGGASLLGVSEQGKRRGTVKAEAEQFADTLRGLELLSRQVLGAPLEIARLRPGDEEALGEAKKFLQGWRADPDLSLDVRGLEPQPSTGEALVAGVFGVGRREIRVSFSRSPEVKLSEAPRELFVTETRAAQRYLIPVLATGAAASSGARPLGRGEFRALCEKAGRTQEAIEGALLEALAAEAAP